MRTLTHDLPGQFLLCRWESHVPLGWDTEGRRVGARFTSGFTLLLGHQQGTSREQRSIGHAETL